MSARKLSQPIDGAAYDRWKQSAPEDDDDGTHDRHCDCSGCRDQRRYARAERGRE